MLFDVTNTTNQNVCEKSLWYADARKEYSSGISNILVSTYSNISWSSDSWELKEDKKGRPGWISEFTSSVSDRKRPHILIFNISKLINQKILNPHAKTGFNIYVMKTYKNAGVFKFVYCEEQKQHFDEFYIDTLWEDFKTFHVSMPALHTKLSRLNLHDCEKKDNQLLKIVHEWKESPKKIITNRNHIIDKRNRQMESKYSYESFKARKSQKVKILSIELCTFATA